MNSQIAANIRYLRESHGLSQGELGEKLGLSRDRIASYERGTEPRLYAIDLFVKHFNISFVDFIHTDLSKTKSTENLTINKSEQKTKSIKNLTFEKGKKKGQDLKENEKYKKSYPFKPGEGSHLIEDQVQKFGLKTDSNHVHQNIPLYNIEASAGLVPLFNNQASNIPMDHISIPNLPKCDGAIYVTGDSMYPLLKSGDIVLYKQITDVENNIFWGEMYLVSIDMEGEEYVTVKYIQRSSTDGHIKLVSHNQHHSDKEVHVSKVLALAFVKASIRINSMQ